MAGELVPLVMLPRYTTYAGTKPNIGFTTVGMDVTEFDAAILNIWRGAMLGGGSPLFKVNCEESTDQNTWTICTGTTEDTEVDEDEELQFNPELTKRWFRLRIEISGTAPVVSCWGVGFLVQRLR